MDGTYEADRDLQEKPDDIRKWEHGGVKVPWWVWACLLATVATAHYA